MYYSFKEEMNVNFFSYYFKLHLWFIKVVFIYKEERGGDGWGEEESDISQFSQSLTEAPALRVKVRDGVVGEVELQERLQTVKGAAVHLPQTVIVQVPTDDKKEKPNASLHVVDVYFIASHFGKKCQLQMVYCNNKWELCSNCLGCGNMKVWTHRTLIRARPQNAPSVSLLMLFLWSLRTSKLLKPWKVSPSINRNLFLLSSLQNTQLKCE